MTLISLLAANIIEVIPDKHGVFGDWLGFWGNIIGGVIGAIVASGLSIYILLTVQRDFQKEQTKYEYKMKILFDESSSLTGVLKDLKSQIDQLSEAIQTGKNYTENLNNSMDKSADFMKYLNYINTSSLNGECANSIPMLREKAVNSISQITNDAYYPVYMSTIGEKFICNLEELKKSMDACQEVVNEYDGYHMRLNIKLHKNKMDYSDKKEKIYTIALPLIQEAKWQKKLQKLPNDLPEKAQAIVDEFINTLSV